MWSRQNGRLWWIWLQGAFKKWQKRWKRRIRVEREYFEGDGWWPVGTTLVFGQIAAPVTEIMDRCGTWSTATWILVTLKQNNPPWIMLTAFFCNNVILLITGHYKVRRWEWVHCYATYPNFTKVTEYKSYWLPSLILWKNYSSNAHSIHDSCRGSSWGHKLHTTWSSADYNPDIVASQRNLLIAPKTWHSINASCFLTRGNCFKPWPWSCSLGWFPRELT